MRRRCGEDAAKQPGGAQPYGVHPGGALHPGAGCQGDAKPGPNQADRHLVRVAAAPDRRCAPDGGRVLGPKAVVLGSPGRVGQPYPGPRVAVPGRRHRQLVRPVLHQVECDVGAASDGKPVAGESLSAQGGVGDAAGVEHLERDVEPVAAEHAPRGRDSTGPAWHMPRGPRTSPSNSPTGTDRCWPPCRWTVRPRSPACRTPGCGCRRSARPSCRRCGPSRRGWWC